jgi:hypothetical protein
MPMVPVGWEDQQADAGCAYILAEGDSPPICGAPRREASSYCPEHHALCHVASGSVAEADRLREVEAIAKAIGGRRARDVAGPSRRFLRRVEHAAQRFSQPKCS